VRELAAAPLLAIGSTVLVLALAVAFPAVLAAVLHVRLRWLLAVGLIMVGIWLSFAASDSGPDELPALATAVLALFLFLLWSAGVVAGRLLARTRRSGR